MTTQPTDPMDELYEAAHRLVERAAAIALRAPNARIDILVAGDEQIRALNRDYRGVDAATDTLAFPPDDEHAEYGSIALSIETAARQAKKAGCTLSDETARLAVHAALHLNGHDHHGEAEASRMLKAEAEALAALQQDPTAISLVHQLDSAERAFRRRPRKKASSTKSSFPPLPCSKT